MDELKLERLTKIRKALLTLNQYPEIIGASDVIDYPITQLEKAYCSLLWQVDEAIRAEVAKRPTLVSEETPK